MLTPRGYWFLIVAVLSVVYVRKMVRIGDTA